MAQYIYIAMAVAGAIWLIGYIFHLLFGLIVLRETKDAANLKAAAEFARSYRSASVHSRGSERHADGAWCLSL